MITTEAEAETKWCPFVRAGMYGEGVSAVRMISVNRDPRQENAEIAPCLGAGCMAWRWTDGGQMRGYCGLAGVPVA